MIQAFWLALRRGGWNAWTMRILAISGSLRAASSNTRLIEALPALAPPGVEVVVYGGLGGLPHFNPDLVEPSPPAPVRELWDLVGACDGLIICSPEYAHGVAGTMKNALDWLAPSLEFPETAVAQLNAAPRAHLALDQMRETLVTMSARIVDAACVAVPLQGRPAVDIAADPELAAIVRPALETFVAAIRDMPAKAFAGET